MPIAVGEKVPDNKFPYVPYTPELDDLVGETSLSGPSTHRSDRPVSLRNWYVLSLSPLVMKISLWMLSRSIRHRHKVGWKESRRVCRSWCIHGAHPISFDRLLLRLNCLIAYLPRESPPRLSREL